MNKNHYTPNAKDDLLEHSRTEYYKDNFTNEKGQVTINMELLPQIDKTSSVKISGGK